MNNVGGGIASVRHKEQVLLEHCESVGRDPAEIERTTGIGTVVIRDNRAEAERVFHEELRSEPRRPSLGGPAGRHARGRRREARAVPGASATAT